jgi:hypothetical protein
MHASRNIVSRLGSGAEGGNLDETRAGGHGSAALRLKGVFVSGACFADASKAAARRL